MTTFKDIHGQTLFELQEDSNSQEAIEFAEYYNSKNKRQVAEIDFHNGRYFYF